MKKILLLLFIIIFAISLTVPSFAIGAPVSQGAYNPPPNQNNAVYTATYELMRSYADVSSVFIHYSAQSNSAEVDGANRNYYPTYMFNTPLTMVAPNDNGFGQISDYSSTKWFYHGIGLAPISGSNSTYIIPTANLSPQFVSGGNRGNSYLYSFPLSNGDRNYAYQYGIVTGEWLNSSDTDSIVTGYSIKWSVNSSYTVSLKGSLSYGYEGDIIQTVQLDRNYNVLAGDIFSFNPQTLLDYDDTVNFDYYVFTGNWTVYSSAAGYLTEYKAYDFVNTEKVDYLNGYNEYTDQIYNIDLYPITRITNKLAFTRQSDSGTLNVDIAENGIYTYDVSEYSQIQIAVDVPTTPIINPDDPISPGQVLYIEDNGFYDVTQYNYVDVNIPTEIIEQQGIMQWLYDAVQGFLTMEIAPDFSIGGVLLFIVGFSIIIWIIKIFLGG